MTATLWIWLTSASLFLLGAACLVLRKQLLAMILGLELMINATNLNIVYYAAQNKDARALSIALLIIAVAAAEAVVGLSLLLALHTHESVSETQGIAELAG